MCGECSKEHFSGIGGLPLDDGPDDRASIGDVYQGREIPEPVVTLVNCAFVCPETKRQTRGLSNYHLFLVRVE